MAIQDDERVKSITVLEKHQEIIDMITAQIPFNDKVKLSVLMCLSGSLKRDRNLIVSIWIFGTILIPMYIRTK